MTEACRACILSDIFLVSNFCSFSSTPASSVSVAESSSRAAAVAFFPASPVRSSERIRAQGPRSSYKSAVGGFDL